MVAIKGNRIHLGHGKGVCTCVRPSDGKATRIAARPAVLQPDGPPGGREVRIQAILDAPLEELFDVREAEGAMPDRARIEASVLCAGCGEATMETRTRCDDGQLYCIPCFARRTGNHVAPETTSDLLTEERH